MAYMAPEVLRKSGHGKAVDWYHLGAMLYELVVGRPPYIAGTRDQLFKNIQIGPLALPKHLSKEARSLIVALLNRNPSKRLGAGVLGAEEIRRHPWFRGIDWDEVLERKLKPPKPRKKRIHKLKASLNIFGDSGKEIINIPEWDYKDESIKKLI
eukprot:TRINITY_DN8404_c0_g6_i1.p1 TRINITY_DN8404_c0_g6~~TRINITY_DN8404_c0_g6_i1.p1  ORF type:complete len:154 (-),score=35.15 TRINITY_DN8404_c0_g6_i1:146-607(-)